MDFHRPFTDSAFFLIAGPCVIESREHTHFLAAQLKALAEARGIPLLFKASFDKANRTSQGSYRGVGLEEGLDILAEVRRTLGIPVLTDVHESIQCAPVAAAVDVLQIPAFLCRQTDLLLAAAATGKPVNIKKGQFLAPWDMQNAVGKLRGSGCDAIWLTERGASFGYNNLVVDMRSIPLMSGFGVPVIFDATHSVQLPGGQGNSSGGQREFVPVLAKAAVAAGARGVFMEVHPDPDRALCDGPNSLALNQLEPLLKHLQAIWSLNDPS